MLRYRLGYAKKGVPTSPADTEKKKPVLKGWQKKATTDQSRIHGEHNSKALPSYDGLLTPTGRGYGRRGRWVLDVDDPNDLDRLEAELGVELRGRSSEVLSPRPGHFQIHWLWPTDEAKILLSVGKKVEDGFEGLDVRGEGGLAMLPPSRSPKGGYRFGNDLPTVEAPSKLVEWATSRNRKAERPRRRVATKTRSTAPQESGKIAEGSRNAELTSICGRLHDGTRDLDQLIEALLATNEERCDPPQEEGEVEKIARWVHKQPPRRPEKKAKLPELIEVLSNRWYERERKKLGGKNEVRFMRLLIRKGESIGTVSTEGLRVRMSFLDAAKRLGCHVNTITNIRDRLVEKGELRYDHSERHSKRDPGTFVLLDPRQVCDSRNNSFSLGGKSCSTITSTSRRGVTELETAHYRHRGPVGYSKEDTLCHVEAYGPKTADELAGILGWTRVRDLRAKHLDYLVALGLLERRGDLYAAPEDYRECQDAARKEKYSTIQARVARERSVEGLWVHVVKESGMVASEEERDRLDAEAAERKRWAFHERLAKDTPEADERCREELNAWDEEREASDGEISVSTIWLAHGESVDPETGEVLNSDDEARTSGTEAPVSTGVDGRILPFGDLGVLYELVDQRVLTDEGTGVLWQVFGDRVGVLLDAKPDEVTFLPPAAVLEGEEAA